jgi:hypothetical protein
MNPGIKTPKKEVSHEHLNIQSGFPKKKTKINNRLHLKKTFENWTSFGTLKKVLLSFHRRHFTYLIYISKYSIP